MPINWNTFDIFAGASGPGITSNTVITPVTALAVNVALTNAPVVEPPPSGYPQVIVHPERPGYPFIKIIDGWYRAPTGETVSYKVVADYILTAKGTDRATLMKLLGQAKPTGGSNLTIPLLVVGAVLLVAVAVKR